MEDDAEVNETSESHAEHLPQFHPKKLYSSRRISSKSYIAELSARYNDCSLSEASDPDLWMQTRNFEGDPLAHDASDGFGNQLGFEDWSMNHEVAKACESAMNTLRDQLELALENNDMERYHQLEEIFAHLYTM